MKEDMQDDYFVGLDIGTNSCGWAVTNDEYDLLKAKGKTLWGVRLFETANTAVERRLFRAARRRLERRKQRIKLLQEFFSSEIAKKDEAFFLRLCESKFIRADKTLAERFTLFADRDFSDKEFYAEFPTIFHLRKVLSSNWTKKYDIRLVYLALAHIMKNRGHFLHEGSNIEEATSFENVFKRYLQVIGENLNIHFETIDSAKVEVILKQKKSRTDKKRELYDYVRTGENENKERALVGLLVGLKTNFSDIFEDENFDGTEEKAIDFTSSGYDDKADIIESILGTDNFEVIRASKSVFDVIVLAGMLNGEKTLSQAKINIYEKHKSDKALLKKLLKQDRESYKKVFVDVDEKLNNYPAYIYSHKAKSATAKAKVKTYEDFKKFLKPFIEKLDSSEKINILADLELNTFLPKQVNAHNGVIPFQLHKMELDAILEQASKHYSFLSIVDSTGLSVQEKIQALFTFKIPYYV